MKFEYRTVWFRATSIDDELNALGAEGWEAYGSVSQRSPKVVDGTFAVLLKRPIG